MLVVDGSVRPQELITFPSSSRKVLVSPQRVIWQMLLIAKDRRRDDNVAFLLQSRVDGVQRVLVAIAVVVTGHNLVQDVLDLVQVITKNIRTECYKKRKDKRDKHGEILKKHMADNVDLDFLLGVLYFVFVLRILISAVTFVTELPVL